jgi:hypothetical protein
VVHRRVSLTLPPDRIPSGAEYIGSALDALLAPKASALFEIIVADNGSTDDTATLCVNTQRTISARTGIGHADVETDSHDNVRL